MTQPTEVPKIDHASEARQCITRAEKGNADVQLAAAQAHATLALAEEQRTASFVAYFAILNDIYTASPATAEPQGLQRISDIVWGRLGL